MTLIDDPDDPRIAVYRDVRERDLVGREGLFIAEGEIVLRHLLLSDRFDTLSVLLAANRAQKLSTIVREQRPQTPVYVASQKVIDAIAGFHLHRGVLALGRQPPLMDASSLLQSAPPLSFVLCLMGIGNHDNMGGVFRNAAAFGAAAILLDPGCCDPLYRKAIRVSVGGALLVPFARLAPATDPMDMIKAYGFELIALSPSGEARLSDLAPPQKTAIVLGAEGPGLPPAVLERCRTVRIPMAEGFDSLNVATTSGVVMHHLTAHRV